MSDLITPRRLETEALIDSGVYADVETGNVPGTCAEFDLNARVMLDKVHAEADGSEELTMSETTAIPSRA